MMGSDESNEKMDQPEFESQAPEEEITAETAETASAEQDNPLAEEEMTAVEADTAEEGTTLAEATPGDSVADEVAGETELPPENIGEPLASSGSGTDEADDPFCEERIQRILDIELPVNVSFGSTKRPLSEVLKLGPGALLELNRAADEPVVLKVNNKVFAKGEIVDVDGYYGVQITEIASPAQRIASLGD